jgi:alpha-glucosidase
VVPAGTRGLAGLEGACPVSLRDGRGQDGAEPPPDWISEFGGSTWTRTADPDGTPGQWYLHLYAPAQPDLNWANPEVAAEFEAILRFWFDLGIDGFRIDVAHGLVKDPEFGDVGDLAGPLPMDAGDEVDHPHWDRPLLHEIYRSWRWIADSYEPRRVFAGEIWVGRPHRLVRYLRPDELHTAFDYLICPWLADLLRRTIDETIESHRGVGAPPTWVLSNHDVPPEVSR